MRKTNAQFGKQQLGKQQPNIPDDAVQALKISERRRQDTQRLSGVGFWELEHTTGNLYWSEEIFTIYNLQAHQCKPNYALWASLIYEPDREFVRNTYENAVQTGQEYNIRYRIIAGNAVKWIEARGITYYDEQGQPVRTIGTAQDISEIKSSQEKIEFMAYHDVLTGLANRKYFLDTLNKSLTTDRGSQKIIAVLFIDLDKFKCINDQYGHDVGDEVLVGVAQKLQQCARSNELFARIGGDEFAGLVRGADNDEIHRAVRNVKKAIDTTYPTRIHEFRISASIGVTLHPQDQGDADILLRHADQAMYKAKELGNSGVHYFDTERSQTLFSRRQLLNEIDVALTQNQFELFYQPRIRLSDGHLAGAEALLRWIKPKKTIPPCTIISAIKNTAEEWRLDQWVIRTVISQINTFKENGLSGPFSLNISPSTVENSAFPPLLQACLTETQVQGTDIEFEILEVESIKDFTTAKAIIEQCQQMGVSFSLDDFGTGYSSLTHFHALPVSKLKIDQRFIKSINSEADSLMLVKSILAIANANNRPVVAEGIESYAIAQTLAALSCEFGQGFGIARPMPVTQYITWAKKWDATPTPVLPPQANCEKV